MYEYDIKDILDYNEFINIIADIKKELKTNVLKVKVFTDYYDELIDSYILDPIYFDLNDLYTQLKEIYFYNNDINMYVSVTK